MAKDKAKNSVQNAVEQTEAVETPESASRFEGDLELIGTKLTVIGRIPLVRRKDKVVIAEHPLRKTAKTCEDHEYRLEIDMSDADEGLAKQVFGTIAVQKFGIAGWSEKDWQAVTNGQVFHRTASQLFGKADKVTRKARQDKALAYQQQVKAGKLSAEDALKKIIEEGLI